MTKSHLYHHRRDNLVWFQNNLSAKSGVERQPNAESAIIHLSMTRTRLLVKGLPLPTKSRNRTIRRDITVLLLAICCLGQQSFASEPPKPPELKLLEKFVGTWDCEAVMKPAIWTPKEVREKSMEVNKLVMGGWYLQGSSRTLEGKTRAILMNTYDPVQKVYRIWRFSPGGSCEEMTGKWDEATSTLTITSDMGNGITSTAAVHLIDKDHRKLHVLDKDGDGKIYLNVQVDVTRSKKQKDKQHQD